MYHIGIHCRRVLCLVTLIAASTGCYWSARLAWADWLAGQATLTSARTSIELAPGNSAYLRRAAEIREVEALSANGLRERAAFLNPLDSQNWIRIAAQSEIEDRTAEAEKELLRAFDVDHQFEPRWALANFYFRSGNIQAALEWARKTLEFGGGDLTSVFQLCWAVDGNASDILEQCIPHRAKVLAQYVQFLDGNGHLDEAGEVARVLMPMASAEQVPMLLVHCTRALEVGRAQAAMSVWNALNQRGLSAGEQVDPEAGRPSVDAGFQKEMTGLGFDWGLQRVDGVTLERLKDRRAVRVVFSRNEPEHSTILGQWIILSPAKTYQFRVTYAALNMHADGLKWVIRSPQNNAVLMSSALTNEGPESRAITVRFDAAAGAQVARLELRYDRAPGTVRPEGSIQFSHLALESVQ